MSEIVITAAVRTAIGSFLGTLANEPASRLGAHVLKHAIQRSKLKPEDVDEVVMGHVLSAGCGQNTARQALIEAGLPHEKTGFTVNQVCGAGIRSVVTGMQNIQTGDAKIVIAGGHESMSQSPHLMHLRRAKKFGEATMIDSMVSDGLWDHFNDIHMGITAENIAEQYDITREAQDVFAAQSQQRANKAIAAGKFEEEIAAYTVKTRKGDTIFAQDEFPRAGTTAESLGSLNPAFKKDGTVTAGNASGLNDGAAAVVLMTRAEAEKRGLPILGVIKSWATAGVDPAVMGTGPIPASLLAVKKAGWTIADLDLIESNEAFAAQSCCVVNELKLDPEKTNVHGGAIALGHPLGASGTRCLVTLLYAMKDRDAKKGLVTLCIGGGMGIAMCVERD